MDRRGIPALFYLPMDETNDNTSNTDFYAQQVPSDAQPQQQLPSAAGGIPPSLELKVTDAGQYYLAPKGLTDYGAPPPGSLAPQEANLAAYTGFLDGSSLPGAQPNDRQDSPLRDRGPNPFQGVTIGGRALRVGTPEPYKPPAPIEPDSWLINSSNAIWNAAGKGINNAAQWLSPGSQPIVKQNAPYDTYKAVINKDYPSWMAPEGTWAGEKERKFADDTAQAIQAADKGDINQANAIMSKQTVLGQSVLGGIESGKQIVAGAKGTGEALAKGDINEASKQFGSAATGLAVGGQSAFMAVKAGAIGLMPSVAMDILGSSSKIALGFAGSVTQYAPRVGGVVGELDPGKWLGGIQDPVSYMNEIQKVYKDVGMASVMPSLQASATAYQAQMGKDMTAEYRTRDQHNMDPSRPFGTVFQKGYVDDKGVNQLSQNPVDYALQQTASVVGTQARWDATRRILNGEDPRVVLGEKGAYNPKTASKEEYDAFQTNRDKNIFSVTKMATEDAASFGLKGPEADKYVGEMVSEAYQFASNGYIRSSTIPLAEAVVNGGIGIFLMSSHIDPFDPLIHQFHEAVGLDKYTAKGAGMAAAELMGSSALVPDPEPKPTGPAPVAASAMEPKVSPEVAATKQRLDDAQAHLTKLQEEQLTSQMLGKEPSQGQRDQLAEAERALATATKQHNDLTAAEQAAAAKPAEAAAPQAEPDTKLAEAHKAVETAQAELDAVTKAAPAVEPAAAPVIEEGFQVEGTNEPGKVGKRFTTPEVSASEKKLNDRAFEIQKDKQYKIPFTEALEMARAEQKAAPTAEPEKTAAKPAVEPEALINARKKLADAERARDALVKEKAAAAAVEPAKPLDLTVKGVQHRLMTPKERAAFAQKANAVSRSLTPEVAAKVDAYANSTNPLKRIVARLISDTQEFSPDTRANLAAKNSLDLVKAMFMDKPTKTDIINKLRTFVEQPELLVKEMGALPMSMRAEITRPIIKLLTERFGQFKSLELNDEPLVDTMQFQHEFLMHADAAAREVYKVKPLSERSLGERLAVTQRSIMSLLFLSTPGFVLRNAYSDTSLAAMDGLLVSSSWRNAEKELAKLGLDRGDVTGGIRRNIEKDSNAFSKFSGKIISGLSKWTGANFWRGLNGNLEFGRRGDGFAQAYREYWQSEWNPQMIDFDKLTPEAKQFVPALLTAVRTKAFTPEQLRGVVAEWKRTKGVGEFDVFKALTDKQKNSLTPDQLGEIKDFLDSNIGKPIDQVVKEAREKFVSTFELQHANLINGLGQEISPVTNSSRERAENYSNEMRGPKAVLKEGVRQGRLTEEQATAEAVAASPGLKEHMDRVDALHTEIGKAIAGVDFKTDPSTGEKALQLTVHMRQEEARINNEARAKTDALYKEASKAIVESNKAGTDGWAAIWQKYREDARAVWEPARQQVEGLYQWGISAVKRMGNGEWDALVKEHPSLANVDYTPGKVYDEALGRTNEGENDTGRLIKSGRTKSATARALALQMVQAAVKTNPDMAATAIDLFLSASHDETTSAQNTLARKQQLLQLKNNKQISLEEYSAGLDSIWKNHWDVTQKFHDATPARLMAARILVDPLAIIMRQNGMPDQDIIAMLVALDQGKPGAKEAAVKAATPAPVTPANAKNPLQELVDSGMSRDDAVKQLAKEAIDRLNKAQQATADLIKPEQDAAQERAADGATTVNTGRPKLPDNLSGTKPVYESNKKQFNLEFQSDVDRASYMVRDEKKPDAQEIGYLKWLNETEGWSAEESRLHGEAVAKEVKLLASKGESGDTLRLADIRETDDEATQAAAGAKPVAAEPAPAKTTDSAEAPPATGPESKHDKALRRAADRVTRRLELAKAIKDPPPELQKVIEDYTRLAQDKTVRIGDMHSFADHLQAFLDNAADPSKPITAPKIYYPPEPEAPPESWPTEPPTTETLLQSIGDTITNAIAKRDAANQPDPTTMDRKTYVAYAREKLGNSVLGQDKVHVASVMKAAGEAHRAAVSAAVEAGKKIHPDVLASYPDLLDVQKQRSETPLQTVQRKVVEALEAGKPGKDIVELAKDTARKTTGNETLLQEPANQAKLPIDNSPTSPAKRDQAIGKGVDPGLSADANKVSMAGLEDRKKGLETILAEWKKFAETPLPDGSKPLSGKDAAVIDKFAKEMVKQMHDMRNMGTAYAKARTDFSFLPYDERRGADNILSSIFPFSFWGTHQGRNTAIRMMENPQMMVAWYRFKKAEDEMLRDANNRSRMSGFFRVLGSNVWVNPLDAMLPFSNMVHDDVNDAIANRSTAQMAYDYAGVVGMRLNPFADYLLKKTDLLVDSKPGDSDYAAKLRAYGHLSANAILPGSNIIHAVSKAAGIGGPLGVNPETIVGHAFGGPDSETWDGYRVKRSIRDMSTTGDPKIPTAAELWVQKQDDEGLLNQALLTAKPEDVAAEMKLSIPEATKLLQVAREAANTSANQQAFSQATSGFLGFRTTVLPQGETDYNRAALAEKSAAYNPMTGLGSRADVSQVRADNPQLTVARGQYGGLPGESKDMSYILDNLDKANINKQFDAAKDAAIAKDPTNRKLFSAIEAARFQALGLADRSTAAPPAALSSMGEQAAALLAKVTGAVKTGNPAVLDQEYRPLSVAGSTPQEALKIRQDEIMRMVAQRAPKPEDFTSSETGIDFNSYKIALDKFNNNLGKIVNNIPNVSAVLDVADKDGQGQQLRSWIGRISANDLVQYHGRNDTPLEAAVSAYWDKVYTPTFEQYSKLKAAGDKDAWAKTIGAVPAFNGGMMAKLVEREYPGHFTPEELRDLSTKISMPDMQTVNRNQLSKDAQAKADANTAFFDYMQKSIPPGKPGSSLRILPAIQIAYSKAAPPTTQQLRLALDTAQGWVQSHVGQVTPDMQQDFAQARQAKQELDAMLTMKVGATGLNHLVAYDAAASAKAKAAVRGAFPDVNTALMARHEFELDNPIYAQYYGPGASSFVGATSSGGGAGGGGAASRGNTKGKSSGGGGSSKGGHGGGGSVHSPSVRLNGSMRIQKPSTPGLKRLHKAPNSKRIIKAPRA